MYGAIEIEEITRLVPGNVIVDDIIKNSKNNTLVIGELKNNFLNETSVIESIYTLLLIEAFINHVKIETS